jgi:lysophospholipase L1-like esterase
VPASLFRYVALGDSTGVGVGSGNDGGYPERLYQRLKRAGVKAGIMNLALSGATTRDLLNGPLNKAIEVRPALITLGIGTNDLWRLLPIESFEANLNAIADGLARTEAEVVVSNIIDLSLAPIAAMIDVLQIPRAVLTERIAAFNARIAALKSRHRFHVVDLHAITARESSTLSQLFAEDGFHPSAKGYERWADELWPSVEAIGRAWSVPG